MRGMPLSGWISVVLSVFIGGWLAFDGSRGLIVGDYVTPRSGPYAGQLGPWARLFEAMGVDPRSPGVMGLHVVLGAAMVVSAGLLMARPRVGWRCLLGASACGLWYLPFGTLGLVVVLVLLLTPGLRAYGSGRAPSTMGT